MEMVRHMQPGRQAPGKTGGKGFADKKAPGKSGGKTTQAHRFRMPTSLSH